MSPISKLKLLQSSTSVRKIRFTSILMMCITKLSLSLRNTCKNKRTNNWDLSSKTQWREQSQQLGRQDLRRLDPQWVILVSISWLILGQTITKWTNCWIKHRKVKSMKNHQKWEILTKGAAVLWMKEARFTILIKGLVVESKVVGDSIILAIIAHTPKISQCLIKCHRDQNKRIDDLFC